MKVGIDIGGPGRDQFQDQGEVGPMIGIGVWWDMKGLGNDHLM